MNTLYYGDNLEILRKYVADESVDLIYLDPPFNSQRAYNVIFQDKTGKAAAAQIQAFEDTWTWTPETQTTFDELMTGKYRPQLKDMMKAFRDFMGPSDLMAYLTMMAIRLVELRRVLKETGSLYLHCDPTASHYLKILLDRVFHYTNFRSEIIWKRTSAHDNPKRWGPVHDTLLFYSKSDTYIWNPTYQDYDADYLGVKYKKRDERGFFRLSDLTGAGITKGDSGKPWRNYDPSAIGRHWAVPRDEVIDLVGREKAAALTTQQKLDLLDKNGFIYWTPSGKYDGKGFPQFKRYLSTGMPIQDIITDIFPINSQAAERLGYPTQKPLSLLERIVQASSNEGDIMLDPFCGCGTAVVAAEKLHRRWIGVDITHLAISLIKKRMSDHFPDAKFEVIGEPKSVDDTLALFKQSPLQFESWAVSLIGGQPFKSSGGGDTGIDGLLYFQDGRGEFHRIIVEVKGGGYHPKDVRALKAVMDREDAPLGILLALEKPTKGMLSESAALGKWNVPGTNRKCPILQIITIEDIFSGKRPDIPDTSETLKRAKREKRAKQQGRLL